MTALMCAFCMNLPGRSQGEDALAWTVINGHAVCLRHHEFARGAGTWAEALAAAAEWEVAMLPGRTGA